MLCLSGFELYSRWVPLPTASFDFKGVVLRNLSKFKQYELVPN